MPVQKIPALLVQYKDENFALSIIHNLLESNYDKWFF